MRRASLPLLFAFLATLLSPGLAPPAAAPPEGSDLPALVRRVEELRGLRFLRPVAREVVTSEDMRAEVRRQLAQEYDPEEWGPIEATLKAFRLIPVSSDLRRLLASTLEQQVAGLYDPRSKKLFVLRGGQAPTGLEELLGDAGLNLNDSAVVHELAHALDDQHFDLLSLPIEERFDQDRSGAAMALVEGSATWVMYAYMFGALGFQDGAMGDLGNLAEALRGSGLSMGEGVPPYIQENLLGAYLDGLALVKRAREKGGAAEVDRLFRRPPASMEQVLHPEKYFAGEAPSRFEVHPSPAWEAEGYPEYTAGVWGEKNADILLRSWGADPAVARRASEGWDGDAYATARSPKGDLAWVWVTRWDTGRDAAEFRDALAPNRALKVSLSGKQVTVVFGGPGGKK